MMIEKPKKEKRKRHRMTIACDISPEVRHYVFIRDGGKSIISGKTENLEVCHFVNRSHGGLGIPENLGLMTKQEHAKYDNGNKLDEYGAKFERHLKRHYPNWDRSKLIYDKWKDLDPNRLF